MSSRSTGRSAPDSSNPIPARSGRTLGDSQYLGRRLRELRKSRSLTQADFASRIDIQQSDLCRMENGQYRVSLETLRRVLSELDVPSSEFFEEPQGGYTDDECAVLWFYRRLGTPGRQEARSFLTFLAGEADAQPERGSASARLTASFTSSGAIEETATRDIEPDADFSRVSSALDAWIEEAEGARARIERASQRINSCLKVTELKLMELA